MKPLGEDVARFKEMLIETLQAQSSAMLLDPHYAYPRGGLLLSPAKGLIMTLEDSVFTETTAGRQSSEIDHWSVEKIKRAGGDAVKVLAWYRPDADKELCQFQQDFTQRIGEACRQYDIPFLFELLVYPLASDTEQTSDYVEMKTKKPGLVVDSVAAFADDKFGVDIFKLESPLAAGDVPGVGAEGGEEAQSWFDQLDEAAGRPWVMLSAGAGKDDFRRILTHAYKAGASGYLAGRAIWLDAFQHFPDWDAIHHGLAGASTSYMQDLNDLTDRDARPWTQHPAYGDEGAAITPSNGDFRRSYKGFGEYS